MLAASTCLDAGAHGITVHPRPDARHIRAEDVYALAVLTRSRGVEFNLEGNPFAPPRAGYPGFAALCAETRPAQATLVPDRMTARSRRTTASISPAIWASCASASRRCERSDVA